jgi:putative hemolysin
MSDIGFEILIISLLIVANGVFAMSEMAVVTARKSRLQDWAEKGNAKAKVALELAGAPRPHSPSETPPPGHQPAA